MKNIILAGVPKSGKTSFAKLLLNYFHKYDIVELNSINLSELNKFSKLIFEFNITNLQFNFDKLLECLKNDYIVLVFGYPKISIRNKVNEIIKNSDNDLSYLDSIIDIKKIASNYIKESKKIKKICEKNNIIFVDTSNNREDILNKLFFNIKDKIKEN